jgi:hypothetical protein
VGGWHADVDDRDVGGYQRNGAVQPIGVFRFGHDL